MKCFVSFLPLLVLVGCASTAGEPQTAEVSGEVFYLERIAAPQNARLEVVLVDISRPGLPAERLGETILEDAGQPPYRFVIKFDPARIDPRHTYSVAARLYDGDDLVFVTDTVHQVITRGHPSVVSVRLRQTQKAPTHQLGGIPETFGGTP